MSMTETDVICREAAEAALRRYGGQFRREVGETLHIGWDRRAAELIIGKAKVLLSVADGDADEVEGVLTYPAREDTEGDGPVIGADVTEVN